ncbi:30S ribosomal protein S6 [Candidatus Saccharibacteria bacterium]|nr:30S ribosomal protein S6 [Candidatus Saccharibacteria bacterium]
MKNYELTVVFHPDLEMNLAPALDKVHQAIESVSGTITKETNDGKKRLAYPLSGQEYGIYYFIDIDLPADGPKKLSNAFNINSEIIRYLLVKVDSKKAKLAARKAEADAKKAKHESEEEK